MNLRAVGILIIYVMTSPVLAQDNASMKHASSADLTSLFFTDSERDAIAQARTQYQEKLIAPSESDLLDQLQGIKNTQKAVELEDTQYEQFYLESLMYHTPTDWTLWIESIRGSDKYAHDTQEIPGRNLQVIQINKESVTFEWKPKNWSYVSKRFTGENSGIILNTDKKTVRFTLWVNQTMKSYDMSIAEGKAAVVRIAESGNVPPADGATTNPLQNPPADSKQLQETLAKPVQEPALLDQYKALEGTKNTP